MQVLMSSRNNILQGEERVLEKVDEHTQVLATSFQPAGLVGRLCAAREVVLLRSWREDADGTFIVLYQVGIFWL